MKTAHIIGFGSQAGAWADCLKTSGWEVRVYLGRETGASYERALAAGFEPRLTSKLPHDLAQAPAAQNSHLVAMLCPDHLIAPLYREFIAASPHATTLILAHGYAVYSGELATFAPGHEVALLAPKAIGPKLLANFKNSRPHALVAAFQASPARAALVRELAQGLGFAESNLVTATFAQEAVGDLISEQGLLCGGVFNLLEWTMENMAAAGVPERLIREECLTELELVAGLIRERGPSAAFSAISQAAQCGTITMRLALEKAGVPAVLKEQAEKVQNGEFAKEMNKGQWKPEAEALAARLSTWQERFKR